MISVTVAAQGRAKRLVGGHLRAYGSGRLSILDLNKIDGAHEDIPRSFWAILLLKLFEILCAVVAACFPYICNFLHEKPKKRFDMEERQSIAPLSIQTTAIQYSPYQKISDKILSKMFEYLDGQSIARCELVCRRWRTVIAKNISTLNKIEFDQIRMLFDEGEMVIYPIDEKRYPTRYPMPSLQVLSRRLRHLRCLSLFVRGLIPVESTPVLRSLAVLDLHPQQIYMIWCKFAPQSVAYLEELLHSNRYSLADVGFEECTPPAAVSDRLVGPLLPQLTSFRIWNDGKGGLFDVSDETITTIARHIESGCRVETLDLASCLVSADAIAALVISWARSAPADLTVSLNFCPDCNREELAEILHENGIFFSHGKLIRAGHSLSLFV